MGDEIDIFSIREALRRAMQRQGAKPTTLSQKVGNRTLVKNLMEKNDDVNVSTLVKLAGALGIPLSDLLSAPRVPITGYIGAGGTIIFEELSSEETVFRPPGIAGDLEALVVRGDSMLPKYSDGDVIYIQKQSDGVLPDYLGQDCAIRLAGGETFLKQLIKGSTEGRFTLLSLNAPPMENVEVQWATPVIFIMPARSRHSLS